MKLPDYRWPNRFAQHRSVYIALYWYVFELYAGHAGNRDLDPELGGPPILLHCRNAPVCMAIAALDRIFYELAGS